MQDFFNFIYNYCTDFIINAANIFGSSYYELNTFIFCVLYPLLLVILIFVNLILKLKLRKLQNRSS